MDGQPPVVICSQLPDNDNTSVTNMAEYLAAEVVEEHSLLTPLTWIEHYPAHAEEIGEYSLVKFSSWELEEVYLGGVWRYRLGSSRWLPLRPEEVEVLIEAVGEAGAWLERSATQAPRGYNIPHNDRTSRRYPRC